MIIKIPANGTKKARSRCQRSYCFDYVDVAKFWAKWGQITIFEPSWPKNKMFPKVTYRDDDNKNSSLQNKLGQGQDAKKM